MFCYNIYFVLLMYIKICTINAVSPMDYESLNMTLMFAACETRRCVYLTIVDDFDGEPNENFFYSLGRSPDLHSSIELDQTLMIGEIEIDG